MQGFWKSLGKEQKNLYLMHKRKRKESSHKALCNTKKIATKHIPTIDSELIENEVFSNFAYTHDMMLTFRINVINAAKAQGKSIKGMFDYFNSFGIKMSREAFLENREGRKRFCSSLTIGTISRYLNVPVHELFTPVDKAL